MNSDVMAWYSGWNAKHIEMMPSSPIWRNNCPGYFTTNTLERSKKNGERSFIVTINPNVTLLQDAYVSYDDMRVMINGLNRLPNREFIGMDVAKAEERGHYDRSKVPLEMILTLIINNRSMIRPIGEQFMELMAELGIDASLSSVGLGRDDLFLFSKNRNVITSHEFKPSELINWAQPDFKTIKEQIEEKKIAASPESSMSI